MIYEDMEPKIVTTEIGGGMFAVTYCHNLETGSYTYADECDNGYIRVQIIPLYRRDSTLFTVSFEFHSTNPAIYSFEMSDMTRGVPLKVAFTTIAHMLYVWVCKD